MKKERVLNVLLCLMTAAVIVAFGCRKKRPEEKPPVALPAEQSEPQTEPQPEPQTEHQEDQPQPPESEQKPLMTQMTPVEYAISIQAVTKMGGMNVNSGNLSQTSILAEDLDVVFPNEIGGFKLSCVGSPSWGRFSDLKKRPFCISYDSDELKSSVCILIEQAPTEVTDIPMSLASCQRRMQEMIEQVSMGQIPIALFDKANANKATENVNHRSGISGLKIDEPSPESKLEMSGLPIRSISWNWRIANRNSAQYTINGKGFHGAEMFWRQTRGNVSMGGRIDNPAAELQFTHTSLMILKNSRLLTIIVQSEGGEAAENHPKAVESFMASFDKDVLQSTCSGFYDRQDEKYEKSTWYALSKQPLPFYATLKKDAPKELLDSCISQEEMQGKSFGEICGVDYDTKHDYSKCDEQSRLADAHQYLILYIKDYAELPPAVRKPLEIVFKGAKGHVDADTLVGVFGSKADSDNAEASALKEKILRGKIMLRTRQVQRITRIIANNKQRLQHALDRVTDAKRTVELEEFIRQLRDNAYNRNDNMNSSDVRKMTTDGVQHIIDEIKSGAVSTRLDANPPNQNYGNETALASTLYNLAANSNLQNNSLLSDLVKTIFDLGDDILAVNMLRNYIGTMDSSGEVLAYMLSNGLDINKTLLARDMQMWQSPRMSHMMVLSNYPIPGFILGNLITEGKNDIVRELLNADIPVNERCNGQLPLAMAIMKGNTELEQQLLANGANKELTDNNGKKPEDYRIYGTYWNALNSKDYKKQAECLAKGINVNQQISSFGWRYIDTALDRKDTEAIRLLLEAGADPSYNFILIRAYQSGQLEVFKLLLKHGAPLEQNGQHLLCTVLRQNFNHQGNSIAFLKEVLAKTDKTKLNEEICGERTGGNRQLKLTPACFAIYVSNGGSDKDSDLLLQKLKVLEEAGADIAKMPSQNSLSPLFFAALNGSSTVDIYSYLVSKGLDVNSVAVPKSTEFFNNPWKLPNEIASKGIEKTALLTYIARLQAHQGFTNGNFTTNVLPYLVEKGARADIKDSYGKSCIDYVQDMIARKTSNAELWKSKLTTLGLMK